MAKHSIRSIWIGLLERLRLRRRPQVQLEMSSEPLPSWAAFLPYLPSDPEEARSNGAQILELLHLHGQLPGSGEQQWLVDQILRRLTGDSYEEFIEAWSLDEDFGMSFDWSAGTPPQSAAGKSSI